MEKNDVATPPALALFPHGKKRSQPIKCSEWNGVRRKRRHVTHTTRRCEKREKKATKLEWMGDG